ncbi:hypothetical protein MTP99_005371 [Tenebrio molitor]|nr:hypothetical protein MTP99_005371 [Tenebrio molitor]
MVLHRPRGSLTTPNCNEVVIWTLFSVPSYLSESQLKELTQIYDADDELLESAVFYEKVQDQQADAQAQGTTCIDVGNLSKSDQKILRKLCKLLPLPLGILGYNNAELDTVINDLKVIKLE